MTLHIINHPVEINFDIKDHPKLTNRIYRILWVHLKYQHLTSQYFEGKISHLTRLIKKFDPDEFKDFLKLVRNAKLCDYGKKQRAGFVTYCNGRVRRSRHQIWRPINLKWWRYIWNLIKYNGDIELKEVHNG